MKRVAITVAIAFASGFPDDIQGISALQTLVLDSAPSADFAAAIKTSIPSNNISSTAALIPTGQFTYTPFILIAEQGSELSLTGNTIPCPSDLLVS